MGKVEQIEFAVIKQTIVETIYGGIPSPDKCERFLEAIAINLRNQIKLKLIIYLLSSFSNARYDNFGNAMNYIPETV